MVLLVAVGCLIRLQRFQSQGIRKDKEGRSRRGTTMKKSPFRVLCATSPRQRQWGSYKARCLNFKSWLNVSSCANLVEMSTEEIPSLYEGIQYDATMYVKSIPPEQANLGTVFVDVVDGWGIRSSNTPASFKVIVQNPMHGQDLFPNHTYHVIEHMYSSYTLDATRDDPEVIPDVISKNILQVGIICSGCAIPARSGDDINVNITFINEAEEGSIDKWFVKYMEGWTEERMNSVIADPNYGFGKLYHEIFQRFDVLVVSPKKWPTKLSYGSVQRITNQMRSGTPVLVENQGRAFSHFLDEYNYPCAFGGNSKHQTFEQALQQMKDASYRKDCQNRGLRIAADFSPRAIGMKTLRAMGFEGQC